MKACVDRVSLMMKTRRWCYDPARPDRQATAEQILELIDRSRGCEAGLAADRVRRHGFGRSGFGASRLGLSDFGRAWRLRLDRHSLRSRSSGDGKAECGAAIDDSGGACAAPDLVTVGAIAGGESAYGICHRPGDEARAACPTSSMFIV